MNQLQDMIGPEFLDALADAEAANSNDINACAMRSNAVAWANDRRRCAPSPTPTSTPSTPT